jgi:hypothetical protein
MRHVFKIVAGIFEVKLVANCSRPVFLLCDSPSGCTFWGKKPWSRKKKILWQLGTLIGAPVGITLIAAIAVPAIIIGVPVWVGKKVQLPCLLLRLCESKVFLSKNT